MMATFGTDSRTITPSVIPAGISITATAVSPTAPIPTRVPQLYAGTWHEQLERDFLQLPNGAITNSLDGGTDYAFGGATTADGTIERDGRFPIPVPSAAVSSPLTVDNLGKQVDDYLGCANTPDPDRALHRLGRRQRFL